MKHTPLIRLQAAYRAKRAASEACAHWDYEGNTGNDDCCRALDAAKAEVYAARVEARATGSIE